MTEELVVDLPTTGGLVRSDVVRVYGRASFPGTFVDAVHCEADDGVRTWAAPARTQFHRADLLGSEGGGPDRSVSGFEAWIPLRLAPGGSTCITLRVRARALNGREQEVTVPGVVAARPAVDPRERRLLADILDRPRPGRTPASRRIAVFTHSLGIGGAQLYLSELLDRLVHDHGYEPVVITFADGPLRADLESWGVAVHVSTPSPTTQAAAFAGRVAELAALLRDLQVSAVLVNTLYLFPGVLAARSACLPIVWTIHESYDLDVYAARFTPEGFGSESVRERFVRSLRQADAVVFEAEATRKLFRDAVPADRSLLIPYGVAVEDPPKAVTEDARRAARRRLGIDEQARVVLSLGVYEPRKNQAGQALAFAEVAAPFPAAVLALVGDWDDPYSACVRDTVGRLGLGDRIRVVEVSPDVSDWYRASDVLWSASDLESMPRSMLEAMLWGLPVSAIDAFGVGELVRDGQEGWLTAPGGLTDLGDALAAILGADAGEIRRRGDLARRRVLGEFGSRGYSSSIAGLLTDLTGAGRSGRDSEPESATGTGT